MDDYYKPGTGVAPCPECRTSCDIEHDISEFSEWINCPDCKMKFVRKRETVIDGYAAEREDKDEYEEYHCYECHTEAIESDYRIHEKTRPVGDFEPIETGLNGYDECTLTCRCGEYYNGYLDLNESIDCECGRTIQLRVDN